MSFLARLQADAKTALKSGDEVRVRVLRYALSEIQNRAIQKRAQGNEDLTDAEVLEVLKKEVKRRKESITLFREGGRRDLVEREEAEVGIIQTYLPPALDSGAIERVVEEVMRGGVQEFTAVMREAMRKLKGQADGTVVRDVVKRKVSEHGSAEA